MKKKLSDKAKWREAKTLDELGELTAQWIEGKASYSPTYLGDSIDHETIPLRETLATFNRKGLVTTFSQPGVPISSNGFGQRACVEGYATESLAKRIGTLCLYTDLVVFIYPPLDHHWGYHLPITIEEYRPYTWCGTYFAQDELEHFAGVCSDEGLSALRNAWQVMVIDPNWGRDAFLWEKVSEIIHGRGDHRPFSVMSYHDELNMEFVF